MKQEPQSNIINYGLPANMYTKTEAFDQDLFLSKSEAAIHYGSHYHRQRSLLNLCSKPSFGSVELKKLEIGCKQSFQYTPRKII